MILNPGTPNADGFVMVTFTPENPIDMAILKDMLHAGLFESVAITSATMKIRSDGTEEARES